MKAFPKRFNELFRLQDTRKEEQQRFLNRINQTVLSFVEHRPDYARDFIAVCYMLGVNADDHLVRDWVGETHPPPLQTLTRGDVRTTLKVVSFLASHYTKTRRKMEADEIGDRVQHALSCATTDLGVRWEDGEFRPSGAPALDKGLVDDVLGCLQSHASVKQDFSEALRSLGERRYGEVIRCCHNAVEGLAHQILGNTKTLDNNRAALIARLKISQEWKAITATYFRYANEFSRHASGRQGEPREVEAFLYLTGLLLRLIVKASS